ASRQNELAAEYPIHVAARWIGNSELIANKHYLSDTDEYFDAALKSGAESGALSNQSEPTGADDSGEPVAEVASRCEESFSVALTGGPSGIRTHSIPGSESRWSTRCLPGHGWRRAP